MPDLRAFVRVEAGKDDPLLSRILIAIVSERIEPTINDDRTTTAGEGIGPFERFLAFEGPPFIRLGADACLERAPPVKEVSLVLALRLETQGPRGQGERNCRANLRLHREGRTHTNFNHR